MRNSLAAQAAGQEIQCAPARERRGLRMVGIALVAVEAVTGSLVDIEDRRRVRRRPDRLEVRRRDARIVASVVIHHRTDRKSTRLNSSHRTISYAVFCL